MSIKNTVTTVTVKNKDGSTLVQSIANVETISDATLKEEIKELGKSKFLKVNGPIIKKKV